MSRRILLITPFAPSPESPHGCPRAVHGLVRELARQNELVLVHLEPAREVPAGLASRCVAVHAVAPPHLGRWRRRATDAMGILRGRTFWAAESGIGALRRLLRSLLRDWPADVVQVEHGVLGDALAGMPALRVVTMHEIALSMREFLPWRTEGLALGHRLDAVSAQRQERRIVSVADAVVTFSERDRRRLALSGRGDPAQVVTIPLGWEVPDVPLDPLGAAPPTLLFVGNFVHPPNVDAAVRLAKVIFPRVRCLVPDARLEIVGDSPPPQLRALADGQIRVTGRVPSVTPHLDRAAALAVPITIGGGVRVKVLEALAAGKAIVATPRAAEGIGVRAGRELIVAENEDEFVASSARLLNDSRLRASLARSARDWAERELSWATMANRYNELYARLERRSQGHGR